MARKKRTKKGLGDTVAKITEVTGIKKIVGDCEGCEKRQAKLNKLFPFKRDLNDAERKEWEVFMNRPNKKTIAKEDAKMIVRLLKNCLGMSVKPCYTCGVSKWNTWVNKINQKYEQGNE
jgi:hypothetical protein